MMVPASDSASVGSFVGWTLVEALAAVVDRGWMMYSRLLCPAVYIWTEAADGYCIAIAGEHMNRSVVVPHSYCSSFLLHLGRLELL